MSTSLFAPLDKKSAALAFVLALLTIAGAWTSQLFGLVPCELCLEQRMAYYWGLPILGLILLIWNRLPLPVWYIAMAIVGAIFVWSTFMGGYHAGVEYGFWPGPTACTGTGETTTFDALSNLNAAHLVPCDQVQFSFLGITLAGYNAIISAMCVALIGISMLAQYRHNRTA
ncbi:disulfide bond formation protein B [Devosia rhodophyticola]|uniref:Disulfide bond formation protein B n=1 Tax=Devosia rhodophyticola TaxID=3026423 RepID=A0ABY7YTD9_9HYPH|nr:disulfide bond formation protein B [Devosia rhodophyticola]WDR04638.1 disulfide bond formation protein B [Devosia rhodophyticola]